MSSIMNKKLLNYIVRFTLTFVMIFIITEMIFTNLLSYLESFTNLGSLKYIHSFKSPILNVSPFMKIVYSIIIALILYPFYKDIIKSKRGYLKLFIILWGLALIGSVECIPGSIEGFIYTKISLLEHFLVALEVTVQMMIFTLIFFKWERNVYKRSKR
ncbi:MAG: hypothetical protein FH751_16395 [Firmicutes bacterium]|nr:hypothetical protein [Bacillota bacterium]